MNRELGTEQEPLEMLFAHLFPGNSLSTFPLTHYSDKVTGVKNSIVLSDLPFLRQKNRPVRINFIGVPNKLSQRQMRRLLHGYHVASLSEMPESASTSLKPGESRGGVLKSEVVTPPAAAYQSSYFGHPHLPEHAYKCGKSSVYLIGILKENKPVGVIFCNDKTDDGGMPNVVDYVYHRFQLEY